MIEVNKIYNEDCLETMKRMEDNSIDLIVTSPPYNKGWYANKNAKQSDVWQGLNGRKIAYDVYNDEMPPEAYVGVELNPEYLKMAERRIAQEGDNLFSDI